MKATTDPVSEFVSLLESRPGWITVKQLSCFADDRTLRHLANASEGKIITEQKGYKVAWHATPEEIAQSARWLEHQAKEMLRRAKCIRRAVAKSSKCKTQFLKHHLPQPTYD